MQKLLKKPNKAAYTYDLYRDGITQSALSNFLTCPEKFNLSMNQGWASEKTGFAINFGNIVHEALDHTYSIFSQLQSTANAFNRCSSILTDMLNREITRTSKFKILNSGIEQELQNNYALAEVVLTHYFKRWFKDDKKRDWVFLEKEFDNLHTFGHEHPPYPIDIPMKGKIDGVFKVGNSYKQLETKTKGQINEKEIMDKLTFDLQNFFYLHNAAILLGKRPAGILYNVIRRPQLKQGAKESHSQFCQRVSEDIESRTDFYFMRWDITVTTKDYDRWRKDFDLMIGNLVAHYENDKYFRNPCGCNAFHRSCQFLGVCANNDFTGLKIRDSIFPELISGD